jgi:TonB family protein
LILGITRAILDRILRGYSSLRIIRLELNWTEAISMPRNFPRLILLALFLFPLFASSQEPGLLWGNYAARYEEAPGYFHYVLFCSMPAGDTSKLAPAYNSALCWPAVAGQLKNEKGESVNTNPVAGIMMVSASSVQFLRNDPKNGSPIPEASPSDIEFGYDSRQVLATMKNKSGTYAFAFQASCFGCKKGVSPIDPAKQEQLQTEYREFAASLTHFDVVARHIKDVSSKILVGINPANQPTTNDPPEAMALYSDLNVRFAGYCSESAQACITSYQKFQACKSGSLQADCGESPSCSVSCPITTDQLKALKADLCTSRTQDSASLVPDWTPVAEKKDAERQARGPIDPSSITLTMDKNPPGALVDFMGKPVDSQHQCSAGASYSTAMMAHVTGPAGGIIGSTFGSAPPAGAPRKKIMIASGIATGLILTQTPPEYPPVAKAARVSGTVVLTAIISKQGKIENLSVVSGPPLLQQAALDAVKTWTYRPYLLMGNPVEVETTINVVFNLGGPLKAP